MFKMTGWLGLATGVEQRKSEEEETALKKRQKISRKFGWVGG